MLFRGSIADLACEAGVFRQFFARAFSPTGKVRAAPHDLASKTIHRLDVHPGRLASGGVA
jgi:hypothetical protein